MTGKRNIRYTALCTLLGLVIQTAVPAQAEAATWSETLAGGEYFDIARAYADFMIEHGRDRYGSVESPVFVSIMDRVTGDAFTSKSAVPYPHVVTKPFAPGLRRDHKMRPYDRTYVGANPLEDLALYKLLYRLTELTGDTNYAAQAELSIDWFLTHAQSAVTGLYCWGSHMNWDVRIDAPVYNDGSYGGHEYNFVWPYWGSHPVNLNQFAYGLWNNQIHNKSTGNFSRHAGYFSRSTASGYEFPETGSCYIEIWAWEYVRTGAATMKTAIQTLLGLYRSMRDPVTGNMAWCTVSGAGRNDTANVKMNLVMGVYLQDAADLVEGTDAALAAEIRQFVEELDDAYLGNDYDTLLDVPRLGILAYYTIADGQPLAGSIVEAPAGVHDTGIGYPLRTAGGQPAASLDYQAPWFVNRSYAGSAVSLFGRYDRCAARHKPFYLKVILESADIYMTIAPEVQFVLYPDDIADVVTLLRRCHGLTGNTAYLHRADAMMKTGLRLFFDDVSPLPKISSFDHWYESSTKNGSSVALLGQMLELVEDLDALPPEERETPVVALTADAAISAPADAGGLTVTEFQASLAAAVAGNLGGRWDGAGLARSSKDIGLTYGAVTNRRDLYLSQAAGTFSTALQRGASFDLSISDVINHIPTAAEADAANGIVPGSFTGSGLVYDDIPHAGWKDVLTSIGIVVSNDSAQAQEVSFAAIFHDTYHDNGSNTLTAVIAPGGSTFFGVQAPSRKWIRRVQITSTSGTPIALEEFGFVLSPRSELNPPPPEPINGVLAHHFTFDTDANDSAGGINGTFAGDAFINTGGGNPVGGGYLELDGDGDWVDLGVQLLTPAGSTVTKELTISGWVRFDGVAKVNPYDTRNLGSFYSESSSISARYNFDGRADQSNGQMALDQYPSSGGSFYSESNTGFTDFEWHHVAYVQAAATGGASRQFYVDGAALGPGSGTPEDYNGTAYLDVAIGTRPNVNGKEPDAGIDDMAFWHEALTGDELRCLYDVALDATLDYDAGEFDQLKRVHDAGSGSVKLGAIVWTYAPDLTSAAGLSGSNPSYTLVLDATAGTGVASASSSVETVITIR